MNRRSFIQAGALLTVLPLLATAKPIKSFKIVTESEMLNLMDELIRSYPNKQIVIGDTITLNTRTFRSIEQPYYLVRLDIQQSIVSVNDIIKI